MNLLTCARVCRFPASAAWLAVALCLLGFPCQAQSAQDYMNGACSNELRQLNSHALWASTSERRTEGHLYLLKTIETVDGDVQEIVSVDGHPPTGADKAKNDHTLQGLLSSARVRADKHNHSVAEKKNSADLLTALPHMFLLEDRGEHDGIETIFFKPDPAFQPQGFEQRAIHEMTGTIRVTRAGMRLTAVDARVAQAVQFGFGILGTLDQGGTVALERTEVAPGVWKSNHLKFDVNGRIALFKNFTRREEETKFDWHMVPPGTTILDALKTLGVHP